jgi:hypothetical protein
LNRVSPFNQTSNDVSIAECFLALFLTLSWFAWFSVGLKQGLIMLQSDFECRFQGCFLLIALDGESVLKRFLKVLSRV